MNTAEKEVREEYIKPDLHAPKFRRDGDFGFSNQYSTGFQFPPSPVQSFDIKFRMAVIAHLRKTDRR